MPVDKFGNEIRQRTTTAKSDEGISLNFANKTYIRLDGESDITGNLNMALRKIENLGEPTNPKDATSKEYVDNTKGTGVIGEVKDETATLKGNLDFEDLFRIKNLPNPADWKDAVNMEYVERLAINHPFEFKDNEYQAKEYLNLKENRIKNLPDPVDGKDAVNREYVDNLAINHPFEFKDNKYQAKTDLHLQGNKIQGVGTPFNDGDLVTKGYVETISAPLLKLEEGEYKTRGDIDMSKAYTICNIKPPIKNEQITDKKYVDEQINFNSAFGKRNTGGYEAKGFLFMRRNKILGLREPLQDGEPATKKYVDDVYNNLLNQFIDVDDNILPGKNVDMEGNQIFNLPEPATDQEPATKKYVDDLQTQHVDQKGNIKFGRNLNLDNKRIFAMKEPSKPNEGANKKYVDDTITKRIQEEKDTFLPQDAATKNYVDEAIRGIAAGDVLVSKEGVFIKENGNYRATAPLDIDNQKMENVPDPVDPKDAANKKYIDDSFKQLTLKQGLQRENGGFNLVDSYLNMNFNKIRNIPIPTDNTDAAPMGYVENMVKDVEERLNSKRKHLISATASFQGDLIRNTYQFTFGGQTVEIQKSHSVFNGFLIPSKGKIKKFVVLDTGLKFYFDKDDNFRQYVNKIVNRFIELFSLVLIREKEEPFIIGTLYFYFSDYTKINYFFKYDDSIGENFYLKQKDIINIKTEFDTTFKKDYNTYSFENKNYNLGVIKNNVFTYLATILIELDPLDDGNDD